MPSDLWPVKWPSSVDLTNVEPEQIELAEAFAASVMRFLTLERVGGRPVTIRPLMPHCRNRTFSTSALFDFQTTFGNFMCLCGPTCFCSGEPFINLPLPVGRVDEVKVGDTILDPSKYSVVDGHYLVLSDGSEWQGCGGRNLTVTYLNGYPVDIMGSYAAGALAEEYLKAVSGDKKCRLPTGVTNITRQGITMEVGTGLFPEGVTGITEVDTYTMLWNPNGLRVRPKVYSPDVNRQRQTTRRKP